MGQIGFVVPSRRGGPGLDRLAAALGEQGVAKADILVAKDGHDAPWELCQAFPDPPGPARRVGFAGAADWGIRAHPAPFLALLNDDLLPEPGFVDTLHAHQGSAPFLSCRLLDAAGAALEFDGGGMNALGHALSLGHGSAPEPAAPREVLFGSGAALALDKEAYVGCGGLATGFFAYYEDMELGWRARRLGLPTLHIPKAAVRHEGQKTTSRESGLRERLTERNSLLALCQNAPPAALPRLLALAWAFSLAREGRAERRGWEARAAGARAGRRGFLAAIGRTTALLAANPPQEGSLRLALPCLDDPTNPAFPESVGEDLLASALEVWEG